MNYAEALEHKAELRREPKAKLATMELKKADNGGVVASHRMTRFEGSEPVHAFGSEEGHLLAAHIEKHMGIKMPGHEVMGKEKGAQSQEPEKEADED